MQMELSREKSLKREMESQLFESHIEVQSCRDMINHLLKEKLKIEQELRGYKQLQDGEMQQLQRKINDTLSNTARKTFGGKIESQISLVCCQRVSC